MDGDGFGDLAITVHGDALDEVFLVRGGASGLNPQHNLIASSRFGTLSAESVQGLGDLNGDGLADFIFGEPNFFNGALVGAVCVFLGRATY